MEARFEFRAQTIPPVQAVTAAPTKGDRLNVEQLEKMNELVNKLHETLNEDTSGCMALKEALIVLYKQVRKDLKDAVWEQYQLRKEQTGEPLTAI